MKKLLLLLLIPMLIGCGNSAPSSGSAEFDTNFQKLMDEPYDPGNGSIYK